MAESDVGTKKHNLNKYFKYVHYLCNNMHHFSLF